MVVEVVRSTGSADLRVTGLSMLPAIWPGDLVTVQRQDSSELRRGQVILFARNGRLTAHRVVEVASGHILTRGDSSPTCDSPLKWIDVVGQVVGVRRNGRLVSPKPSIWQGVAALILRRSAWCSRLFLHLSSRMRRLRVPEPTFEY